MNTVTRTVVFASAVGAALAAGAGVAGAGGLPAKTGATAEPCERGEFCVWSDETYQGAITRIALRNANPGECVPLPDGVGGRSFANRTSRPVTVYQGHDCDTEGEFDTYPGLGTFVPEAPYVVRGVQIWEH